MTNSTTAVHQCNNADAFCTVVSNVAIMVNGHPYTVHGTTCSGDTVADGTGACVEQCSATWDAVNDIAAGFTCATNDVHCDVTNCHCLENYYAPFNN